jgi:hypothetical protein
MNIFYAQKLGRKEVIPCGYPFMPKKRGRERG